MSGIVLWFFAEMRLVSVFSLVLFSHHFLLSNCFFFRCCSGLLFAFPVCRTPSLLPAFYLYYTPLKCIFQQKFEDVSQKIFIFRMFLKKSGARGFQLWTAPCFLLNCELLTLIDGYFYQKSTQNKNIFKKIKKACRTGRHGRLHGVRAALFSFFPPLRQGRKSQAPTGRSQSAEPKCCRRFRGD